MRASGRILYEARRSGGNFEADSRRFEPDRNRSCYRERQRYVCRSSGTQSVKAGHSANARLHRQALLGRERWCCRTVASHPWGPSFAFCGASACASRGPSRQVVAFACTHACGKRAPRNRSKLRSQSTGRRIATGSWMIFAKASSCIRVTYVPTYGTDIDETRLDRDARLAYVILTHGHRSKNSVGRRIGDQWGRLRLAQKIG